MPENQEKKDLGQQKFLFFHKPDENQRIQLEKNLLGEKETKKEPENEERAQGRHRQHPEKTAVF